MYGMTFLPYVTGNSRARNARQTSYQPRSFTAWSNSPRKGVSSYSIPFGGSGTTYDVCERTDRRWIGIEIESCDVIIERLEEDRLKTHECTDWIEGGA